jgi:hypothetical protein
MVVVRDRHFVTVVRISPYGWAKVRVFSFDLWEARLEFAASFARCREALLP